VLELALLIVGCALATYLWRGLGMLVSGRVRMDSEFFIWAGCVAYALIAGLAVRILLLPTGTLAATPLPDRLAACAIALIVYFVFRRNLIVGIAAGFVSLVTLVAIRSGF
jgi:branched-subunit amino acid transport protein